VATAVQLLSLLVPKTIPAVQTTIPAGSTTIPAVPTTIPAGSTTLPAVPTAVQTTIPAVQTTIPTAIATSFTPCTDILPHLGGYEAIKRITPETVLFYSLSL